MLSQLAATRLLKYQLRYGNKMVVDRFSIKDTSSPVVVLYTYHYGQLGLIRTFGRLGIKVHGVDPHSTSPGLFSRYCIGKFRWDIDAVTSQASVQYLLKVARIIGKRSILIHTTDYGSSWLAKNADSLSDRYIFQKSLQKQCKSWLTRKICSS